MYNANIKFHTWRTLTGSYTDNLQYLITLSYTEAITSLNKSCSWLNDVISNIKHDMLPELVSHIYIFYNFMCSCDNTVQLNLMLLLCRHSFHSWGALSGMGSFLKIRIYHSDGFFSLWGISLKHRQPDSINRLGKMT